jgi:hypothetical protein
VTTRSPAAGPVRHSDSIASCSADELIRELHQSHALTLIRTARLLLRDQRAYACRQAHQQILCIQP